MLTSNRQCSINWCPNPFQAQQRLVIEILGSESQRALRDPRIFTCSLLPLDFGVLDCSSSEPPLQQLTQQCSDAVGQRHKRVLKDENSGTNKGFSEVKKNS